MILTTWPFSLALVVGLALTNLGCLQKHEVGITRVAYPPTQRTELSCLNKVGGSKGKLTEGEIDGRPVVSTSGLAVGFSPTLNEVYEQEGVQVFAGQSCLVRYRLCDGALVLKSGTRRAAVYWTRAFPGSTPFPASTSEVLAQVQHPVVDLLRAVDLDAAAYEELRRLAISRRNAALGRLALVVTGGIAAGIGLGGGTDLGVGIAQLATTVPIPGDLKEVAERHPRLVPFFRSLEFVITACAGEVK